MIIIIMPNKQGYIRLKSDSICKVFRNVHESSSHQRPPGRTFVVKQAEFIIPRERQHSLWGTLSFLSKVILERTGRIWTFV